MEGVHEPGFLRTELLVEGSSTIWPELKIDDYADPTARTIEAWKGMNGRQGGDPKKLGRAPVILAGADVMAGVEQNLATVRAQIDAHRELSASLIFTE